MSTEPLRGSDAISVRELADMRSAGKGIRFSMSGKRESLMIFADWKALCMFRWRNSNPAPTTSRPDQLLVVICHHGARDQMVVDFLRKRHGSDNAVNLDGGIDAWALRGRPIDAALSIACAFKEIKRHMPLI